MSGANRRLQDPSVIPSHTFLTLKFFFLLWRGPYLKKSRRFLLSRSAVLPLALFLMSQVHPC